LLLLLVLYINVFVFIIINIVLLPLMLLFLLLFLTRILFLTLLYTLLWQLGQHFHQHWFILISLHTLLPPHPNNIIVLHLQPLKLLIPLHLIQQRRSIILLFHQLLIPKLKLPLLNNLTKLLYLLYIVTHNNTHLTIWIEKMLK